MTGGPSVLGARCGAGAKRVLHRIQAMDGAPAQIHRTIECGGGSALYSLAQRSPLSCACARRRYFWILPVGVRSVAVRGARGPTTSAPAWPAGSGLSCSVTLLTSKPAAGQPGPGASWTANLETRGTLLAVDAEQVVTRTPKRVRNAATSSTR